MDSKRRFYRKSLSSGGTRPENCRLTKFPCKSLTKSLFWESDTKVRDYDEHMNFISGFYKESYRGTVYDSDEDSDVKSDAATSGHRNLDTEGSSSEGERCVDEILYKESVKKKLECLGGMVGVDSGKPSELLAEVIRVLKDLQPDRAQG